MSLVTCGLDLRDKVPYTEAVNSLLWSSASVSSGSVCETPCGGSSLLVPVSSLNLSQCGSCLKEKASAGEQLQYGCHWCTTVMARLHYSLSPRVPVWSDVVQYLDGPRTEVDVAWAGLSACERGRWVASSCMLTESGVPYTASEVPLPTNESKSQTTMWALIGSGMGVLCLIILGVWYYRVRSSPSESSVHIPPFYEGGHDYRYTSG